MNLARAHFLAANATASVAGIGFIRLPSGRPFGGTVASALAAGAAFGLNQLDFFGTAQPGFLIATAAVTLIGVWAAHFACRSNEKDPKRIVIDEWAGVWTTMLFLPLDWFTLPAAFLIFRVLDMTKPFGIKKLERLPGGVGVMLDDIGAGLLGAAILNAAYWGARWLMMLAAG